MTVGLRNCNFSSWEGVGSGSPTVNISGQQTAAPVFADLAAGDVHQLASSPTIDAGLPATATFGTADYDGDARTVGAQPDIGADQYFAPVPPPPGGTTTTTTPTTTATPASTVVPPATTTLPPAALSALTVARRQRGRRVRGSLRTGVANSTLSVALTTRVGRRTVTIGRLRRFVRTPGLQRFSVTLTRAGRARLRRRGRLTIRLRVTVTPQSGTPMTRRVSVALRR